MLKKSLQRRVSGNGHETELNTYATVDEDSLAIDEPIGDKAQDERAHVGLRTRGNGAAAVFGRRLGAREPERELVVVLELGDAECVGRPGRGHLCQEKTFARNDVSRPRSRAWVNRRTWRDSVDANSERQ